MEQGRGIPSRQGSRQAQVTSSVSGCVHKQNHRGIAHWNILSGELQQSGHPVHLENGDMISPLVAAIKIVAGRIKTETARIIPSGPLVRDLSDGAIIANGKNPNAVMQSVARVNVLSVIGNQNLGAKIASRVTLGERGNGLPGR